MAEFLFRRNVVLEALRGQRRPIFRLWVQKDVAQKELAAILALARTRKIPVEMVDRQTLGHKTQDSSHQGVALEVGGYVYSEVEEMLALARQRSEKPFLLLLDLLHGPQNIGALLRTAEVCGVHGVILQDRRAPDMTTAVTQFSAGATEHLLIAQVTNLVQTMKQLQKENIWLVGLDMTAEALPWGKMDLDIPVALVVGHEGEGLRRLVQESCDLILRLPMRGKVESLNAAVAGSVALYAVWQARGF